MKLKEGTTTDEYVETKLYPLGQKANIIVANKDANIMTIKIWGYVTKGDTDSGIELRAEGDLAASTIEELEVTKVYEEIIVSVKTKTAEGHSTFEIHGAISKVGV